MNFLRKGIIYLFSFRDTLGFFLGSIPLRIGEIFSFLYVIPLIRNWDKNKKITKNEKLLFLALIFNLILTIIGIVFYSDYLKINFAYKYILRNILNVILIGGFIYSSFVYTEKDIKKLIKFGFILQFTLFILLYVFQHFIIMGTLLDISAYKDNGVNFGNLWVPRFIGTCTEPGYLAPILPMFLFYYLNKMLVFNNRHANKCLFACVLMIIATFSAAVYVMSALIVLYVFIKNYKKKKVQKAIIYFLFIFLIILSLITINNSLSDYIINGIANKVIAYITLSTNYMMSSNDRVQQILNCIDFISKGDFLNYIIGNGTGSYAYYVSNKVNLISTAEEAYNIYLSTIADRGILGILVILLIFYVVKGFVIKEDLYSQTIFAGICLQFLHWIIVGNFWLYYFWYEIVVLIGYYRNIKNKSIYTGDLNAK